MIIGTLAVIDITGNLLMVTAYFTIFYSKSLIISNISGISEAAKLIIICLFFLMQNWFDTPDSSW